MTSPRSILIGVTAASLFGLVGVVSTATAASAPAAALAPRHDTSVRFLDFDHTRSAGSTTSVRGQVTFKSARGLRSIPGVRVTLLRQIRGSSTWKTLGTDATSRNKYARFVFHVRSVANATYRVAYHGNAKYKPSSNSTSVSVYRAFNARLRDRTGRFHGRVAPRYAHRTIFLEKSSCATCSWKRVRAEKTGHHGIWSFKVGAPRHGYAWWRVTTPASTTYITSHSGVFSTHRR